MKAFWYRRILSSVFVAGTVTAALIGIFFAGWKLAGLPNGATGLNSRSIML